MGWLKTIPAFSHGSQNFSETFFMQLHLLCSYIFYAVTSDPAFRSAFHSAFDFAFDFAIVATFKMTKQSGIVLP